MHYTYSDSPTLAECFCAIFNHVSSIHTSLHSFEVTRLQYVGSREYKYTLFKVLFYNILGAPYHYYLTHIDGTALSRSG